jgi:sensor histidine kinase YesM
MFGSVNLERMKVALFLSLVIHFSLIAFAKESPKTGSKIEDVNGDLESCYRGLYDTGKKSLINETEWRSYRDMIYVTIRLEQFHEGNNTVTIVFAKSVVFFLIDPLMLKKITTPLLQLFGMVYPYPVEQIKVDLDVPACSNNTVVRGCADLISGVCVCGSVSYTHGWVGAFICHANVEFLTSFNCITLS